LGLFALAILASLGGCASQSGSGGGDMQVAKTERVSEPEIKEIPPKDTSMTAPRNSPSLSSSELAARNSSGSSKSYLMDVLFDFDQASLRLDALTILETNAKRLKEDGVRALLLEGRADEIGTSAYNIVLGDHRAKSVRSYLQQLGFRSN